MGKRYKAPFRSRQLFNNHLPSNRPMKQIPLFDETEHYTWFKEYHNENPHIYEFFKRYALRCIERGFKHLSAEFIFNVIRWETPIKAGDEDFKINNNAKPFYSRLFMQEYPQYEGFFKKRTSKADVQYC